MENVLKKFVRWILGWYVEPIRNQCIQAVSELGNQQTALQEKLRDCKIEVTREQQQQLDMLRELQKQIEQQQLHALENCTKIDQSKDTTLQIVNNIAGLNQQIFRLDERLQKIEMAGTGIHSKQADVIYAYRYLLNREPENQGIIERNTLDWHQLRENISNSREYRTIHGDMNMPCFSLTTDGITYFYKKGDCVIPGKMVTSETSWGSDIIENFIRISDQYRYNNQVPCEGWFLDIGGNIGTTSIYCKLRVKPQFCFLAFEPVTMNVKLFAANAAFNEVPDIQIEQLALSNQVQERAEIKINPANWGNNRLVSDGSGDEEVAVTTLDTYLAEHRIEQGDIKYIWIDVEGHEPEVLEGAALLYQRYRIPTCLEFNQKLYKDEQKYEKMLSLLETYFTSFVVCEKITEDEVPLRPIREIELLWEELNQNACDLILI